MIYLSMISFLCVIFYAYLGLGILKKDESSNVSRIFFLVCLAMTEWSFAYVFMFNAVSKNTYEMWYKFASFAWILLPVLIFNFVLELTGKEIKKQDYILMYFMPVLLLYRVLFKTLLTSDYVKDVYWKEIMDTGSFWFWLYIVYALVFMILGLGKVIIWGKKSKLKREKKQAFLIIVTFPLSLLVSLVLNIILPAFVEKAPPPLSHVYLVLWLGVIWYAIGKYHFIIFDVKTLVNELVEKTMDMLILVDDKLKIRDINLKTINFLSAEKEELIGMDVCEVLRCLGDENISLDRILKIKNNKKDMELYNNKDVLHVKVSFNPVKDNLGDLIGILLIGEDITYTKKLELEINERKIVEEKLKKALREIEETQEKLISTEKLAIAGRLAGGLAHELNSPLGAILSSAQYIKEELNIKENSDLLESISIVEDGVYKARKIILELLRYTNANKKWISKINMYELVYDSLAIFEEEFENNKIKTDLDLEPQVYAYGNSLEIMQVINSLLSNSKDSIEENNGDKIIKIKLYKKDRKAYLEIIDNGCGMDEKTLKRAFEPFFSKSNRKNKVGLGLSTAYDIVKKHKGSIFLKSEALKGTEVLVELNNEAEYSKLIKR